MIKDIKYKILKKATNDKINFIKDIYPYLAVIFIFIVISEFLGTIISVTLCEILYRMNVIISKALFTTINIYICSLLSIIIVFSFIKFAEKKEIRVLGFDRDRFMSKYIKGFIIGFFVFTLVVLFFYIFDCIKFDINNFIKISKVNLFIILTVLVGWVIQGASEEIMIRGWLMNRLTSKFTTSFAVIFSSIVFSLLHSLNPNITKLAFLNLFLFGVFMSMYVIKEKTLWGACAIHSAWNFSQGNIYGFNVSGIEIENGTLMSLIPKGKDYLTGGEFGPEGSILVTLVLILSIIILLNFNKKQLKLRRDTYEER